MSYRTGEADALNGLGELALATGAADRSVHDHSTALAVASDSCNETQQARAHLGLARARHALGQVDLAADHAKQSLELYTGLAVPDADEVREFLAGLG